MAKNKDLRRTGDRKEGRLLRKISPFYKFKPYIMKTRNDAQNFHEETFEVSSAVKMLRTERVKGYKYMSFFHFMIAAYIRSVSMLPGINRFVAGRKIYARNNIEVIMTVKRARSADAGEVMAKVVFEPTDTIFDVYRKINIKINEINTRDDNKFEDIASAVCALPRLVIRLIVLVLRGADYLGLLPKKLLDASPFHGSMEITDLGSLKISPIYHHIYNFGTVPVHISFGARKHVYELDRHGKTVDKRYIDTKFVFDERIANRQYFAQFLMAMKYIFAHPQILESAPSRTIDDIN